MRRYFFLCIVVLSLLVCTGCSQNESEHLCVVCKMTATHCVMGSAEIWEYAGIDLTECEQVNPNVYIVWFCDYCDKTLRADSPVR